jgi:amino acid transporter
MFKGIMKILIGRPLKSEEIHGQKFNVIMGLPILASDAISSVAYAGEEILWVLVPIIGGMAYEYMFYAAVCIIALLFILVFSYRQTIDNYPNGGGAFIVAKDNLGNLPGTIAGSALLIDYILTVAVSSSAGTAAITSAIPGLLMHKVLISISLIVLMTIGNLRGIKEASSIFSIPTYFFVFTYLALIGYGLYKIFVLGFTPHALVGMNRAAGDVTVFLFLRAFAAGCTALTGVEAVSNAIPNFVEPAQKHAKQVLVFMAFTVIIIFGGTSYLSTLYHAVPNLDKTVISQIADQVFGNGIMFYMVQVSTAIILVMAANTSFSGFPLLLSVIAKDGYAPRQFYNRGQRLGFSNGIIFLALSASIITIIFRGETHYLLPLYAVGVFISFTLSQSGMFKKIITEKKSGWAYKSSINGLGAIVTFITVIIISVTKFFAGAWIVCLLIPIIVKVMYKIKSHYLQTAHQLSMVEDKEMPEVDCKKVQHFIVPVSGLNKGVIKALNYSKCLSDDIIAFHVSADEEETEKLKEKWRSYDIDVPLIIKQSPYREIVRPLIEYIESDEHPSGPDHIVTIVMPEFMVSAWWGSTLHNQTALFIRNALLKHRHIAVITVPYIIKGKNIK